MKKCESNGASILIYIWNIIIIWVSSRKIVHVLWSNRPDKCSDMDLQWECEKEKQWRWESGNDEELLHSLRGLFLKDGWLDGYLHSENQFSSGAWTQITPMKWWRDVVRISSTQPRWTLTFKLQCIHHTLCTLNLEIETFDLQLVLGRCMQW